MILNSLNLEKLPGPGSYETNSCFENIDDPSKYKLKHGISFTKSTRIGSSSLNNLGPGPASSHYPDHGMNRYSLNSENFAKLTVNAGKSWISSKAKRFKEFTESLPGPADYQNIVKCKIKGGRMPAAKRTFEGKDPK